MTYFELTDAERYHLAAFWVLIFTFGGLAFAWSTGVMPPWLGALSCGSGALIGWTICITWAHARNARTGKRNP